MYKKLDTESLFILILLTFTYFLIILSYKYIEKNVYLSYQSLIQMGYIFDLLKTLVLILLLIFVVTAFIKNEVRLNINFYINYVGYGFCAGFLAGYIICKIII